MSNFTCVVIFVFVFIIGFDGYTQQLYEGSKCCNIDDSPGVCTRVLNCPIALKSIKTSGRTGLKRCGFDNLDEIVCCPETQSPTSQTDDNENKTTQMKNLPVSGTRSIKVCDNYTKLPIVLTKQIVGGENAVEGEFPHMVALGFWNEQDQLYKFDCGGTLISNNYVVTAAHCIANVEQNELKLVRMGTVNVPATIENPDPKYDYNVANVVTPRRGYNRTTKLNDIALVKLEKEVTFTDYIRPACLYTKDDDPENLVITGWGILSSGERSTTLQKAIVSPVPLEQCNNTYQTKKNIAKTQICAANNRIDACEGDSGGPLQKQMNDVVSTIVGVTSYGNGCASRYPGIYTRIYSYLSWIEEIVWP